MVKKLKANTKIKNTNIPTVSIAQKAALIHGLGNSNNDKEHPSLNLKYYDCDFECFSDLSRDELKSFSELSKKFRQLTWLQIKSQGGKGKTKTGLAPTMIERSQLPQSALINEISDDIDFMELRLSEKARIFGFRSQTTFFLVFLDHNHRICN